jgi:hypothetical protein
MTVPGVAMTVPGGGHWWASEARGHQRQSEEWEGERRAWQSVAIIW